MARFQHSEFLALMQEYDITFQKITNSQKCLISLPFMVKSMNIFKVINGDVNMLFKITILNTGRREVSKHRCNVDERDVLGVL